jgi:hypothetical protein
MSTSPVRDEVGLSKGSGKSRKSTIQDYLESLGVHPRS